MKKILFILFILFQSQWGLAKSTADEFALDLQGVKVQDALHILAKQLQKNIVISSQVLGNLSLHLDHITPAEAFDFIVATQGLAKLQENGIWIILPKNILIQQKQEEARQQEVIAAAAPLFTRIWQLHYAKAEDVSHLLQDANHSLLSKRGFIQMDTRTNQLCVRDIVENLSPITQFIKRVDIPVKQVLIAARLMSIDSDFERQLGIHFGLQANTQIDNAISSEVIVPNHYSIAVATLADGTRLDVQLAALENEGHAELISNPSLFTANQQPAVIESGEEIPYQEISRSGATGVAFKKAVLSLKVTPQILPNNRVQLQLQVNQDRPNARMVLGVPAITTRQISSNILARNGQTIVLGGIFESNKGAVHQRLPFISQIPLLGAIFQESDKVENRRELLIFITPKIIEE